MSQDFQRKFFILEFSKFSRLFRLLNQLFAWKNLKQDCYFLSKVIQEIL